MQPDIAERYHKTANLRNFGGLHTVLADYRAARPGLFRYFADAVLDAVGNVRPRDGYERWWPVIPQRVTLGGFEPDETWVGVGGVGISTAYAAVGFYSAAFAPSASDTTIFTNSSPALLTAITSSSVPGDLGVYIRIYVEQAPAKISSAVVTLAWATGSATFPLPLLDMPIGAWQEVRIGTLAVPPSVLTSIVFTVVTPAYSMPTPPKFYVDDLHVQREMPTSGSLFAMTNKPDSLAVANSTVWVGSSDFVTGWGWRGTVCNSSPTALQSFQTDGVANAAPTMLVYPWPILTPANSLFRRGVVAAHAYGNDLYLLVCEDNTNGNIPASLGSYAIYKATNGDLASVNYSYPFWSTAKTLTTDRIEEQFGANLTDFAWEDDGTATGKLVLAFSYDSRSEFAGAYAVRIWQNPTSPAGMWSVSDSGGAIIGVGTAADCKLYVLVSSTGAFVICYASLSEARQSIQMYADIDTCFTTHGTSTWSNIAYGSGNGQFKEPGKLATDGTSLYVVDAGNYRIQTLVLATGVYSSQFGSYGTGDDEFLQPSDVAVLSVTGGTLLVADRVANRVAKWTSAGVYVSRFAPSYAYAQDSFGLGGHEFIPTATAERYLLAGFGDTLYADRNEAKAPYPIKDRLTRNAPLYFTSLPYGAVVCNGNDAPFIFTQGGHVRDLGFPAPGTLSLTLTPATAGSLTALGTYYYGVSFVYGEGALRHGESSVTNFATPVVLTTGKLGVDIAGLPLGSDHSMVVARRIYRCLAGAGGVATKYFVGEINDNTTTTFADTVADSALGAAQEDNDTPPLAQYCCYYAKGLVLAKDETVYWSRPGVNLNERPEIFPAENRQDLQSRIKGFVVFNNNLYIGLDTGWVSAQWSGSALIFRLVAASEASRIGLADQRAVTVWGNQYMVFKEANTGQLRTMLPNEVFPDPLSDTVAPWFMDSNPLPVTTSANTSITDMKSQWDLGTIGANLTVSDSGELSYQYPNVLEDTTEWRCTEGTATTAVGMTDATRNTRNGDLFDLTVTSTHTITPAVPVLLQSVLLSGISHKRNGIGNYSFDITLAFKDASGVQQASLTRHFEATRGYGGENQLFEATVPLVNPIYIGQGQTVTVLMSATGSGTDVRIGFKDADRGITGWSWTHDKDAGTGKPRTVVHGFTWKEILLTEHTGICAQHPAGLQRWANVLVNADLRGGASIEAHLDTSTNSTFSGVAERLAFRAEAVTDIFGVAEPVWLLPNGTTAAYPLRDYRHTDIYSTPISTNPGASGLAAEPQRLYSQVRLVMDPRRTATTRAVSDSDDTTYMVPRVSDDYDDVFPVVRSVLVTSSQQTTPATAFAAPYDRWAYADDIFTSEVKDLGSLGRLGKLFVSMQQEQQDLAFQIRTGTTAADVLTRSWVSCAPNDVMPAAALVSSAQFFQWRVSFQDIVAKEGQAQMLPSVIRQVAVSFGSAGAALAPLCPPALAVFNEQLVGSWTTQNGALPDSTFWMAFKYAQDGSKSPMFSAWTNKHFAAFVLASNKCFGMPTSGGVLYRMFNSAIGDDPQSWPDTVLGIPAVMVTQPCTLGTPNLKTMQGLNIGLDLAFFKGGAAMGSLSQYSLASDGSNTTTPAFTWSLGANPDADTVALSSGLSVLNSVVSSKQYQELLSHAAMGVNQGNNYRPYCAEYFFDVGIMERAFFFGVRLQPYRDANGRSVFPVLTNISPEFAIENLRGV